MIVLLACLTGLTAALVCWQLTHILLAVPREDRSLLDQPPAGFRLCWPVIRVIEHHVGSVLTESQRQQSTLLLNRAGLQHALNPSQLLAASLLAMCLFVAMLLVSGGLLRTWTGGSDLPWWLIPVAAALGYRYPKDWLQRVARRRQRAIVRAFPFYLDIVTLAVESGSNLTGGLSQAVRKSPDSPLRQEVSRVMRDIRAGKARAAALRDMAQRADTRAVDQIINSMIQAERTGSGLAPLLREQAEHLRSQRFITAERLAMQAPVKLLLPLVTCIFPTTFLVLGFVIVSKAVLSGAITWPPLIYALSWPGN